MSDFLITIHGPKASGKTSLIKLLLDAMADNGVMTLGDTRVYTANPMAALNAWRIDNLDQCEAIDIRVDAASMVEYAKGRESDRKAVNEQRLVGALTIDPALLDITDPKELIMRQISSILDSMLAQGRSPLTPMTLTIDQYVVRR